MPRGIVYQSAAHTHSITWLNIFGDICRLLPIEHAHALESLLQVPTVPSYEKMEALLEGFKEDTTLVLLDNLEHVIDPETRNFLDQDLETALKCLLDHGTPHLKFLLTTRIAPKDLGLDSSGTADVPPFT